MKGSTRGISVSVRERIQAVFDEFGGKRNLSETKEQDTRCDLIDKVLEALGWTGTALGRESTTQAGDFLDYLLKADETPWLVVEAKRVGKTFHLDSAGSDGGAATLLSLRTLLNSRGQELRKILKKAADYCNAWAVPYACVTNGYQWIFFRGLSSDKVKWGSGRALIFQSPTAVMDRFDDFASILGKDTAFGPFLPRVLEQPSSQQIPRSLVPAEHLLFRKPQLSSGQTLVVRSVAEALLTDIHGHDKVDMLDRCYVSPGLEEEFEHRVQRLLKDSADDIDTGDHELLEASPKEFADDVCLRERKIRVNEPILVVGHVGVGKTTFLHKALRELRDEKTGFCGIVDLTGRGQGGQFDAAQEEAEVSGLIVRTLRHSAATTLKGHHHSQAAMSEANPFHEATLRTMFRREIREEREKHKSYWEANPGEWGRREKELISSYSGNSVEFLIRYVRHLRSRFKRDDGYKYPILLVLDNLDRATDDYQRCIYGLAERIAAQTPAILVVCLREETYRRGWQEGGFLSSGQMKYICHVAAPPLAKLLRKRAAFGLTAIESERLPKEARQSQEEVDRLCKFLEKTFLDSDASGRELVALLAGHNTRTALAIVREVAVGSGLEVEAGQRMDEFVFDSLLPLLSTEMWRKRLSVSNCFETTPSIPTCHALRTRLLAYYSAAFDSNVERMRLEQTARVLTRFASWGYRTTVTEEALLELLRDGLLRPQGSPKVATSEPTLQLPRSMSLTAAGHAHLERLLSLPAYRIAMSCLTRWYEQELAELFVQKILRLAGVEQVTMATIRSSGAVRFFEAYLAKSVQTEDVHLANKLRQERWVREVLARSSRLLPRVSTAPTPDRKESHLPDVSGINNGKPERWLFPLPPTMELLPRIAASLKYAGTVWIPRILWAL